MPLGGRETLVFAQVMPVGKAPNVSVPLPLIFTSDGCTVNEKLLGA